MNDHSSRVNRVIASLQGLQGHDADPKPRRLNVRQAFQSCY